MLSRSPFLDVVGTARDGQEALDRVVELEPDVVTCDLIMPNLDGVGFVREQMARKPVPIVIVSVASESGELVLSALDAGAVDFIQKPTALASDRLLEIGEDLIAKVKAAADARLRRPRASAGRSQTAPMPLGAKGVFDIVVLGISTGGPQALRSLIPQIAGRLAGAVGHRAAHAGRLHRAVRAQAGRAVVAERGGGDGRAASYSPERC